MAKVNENLVVEDTTASNIVIGVYSVYDSVLKQFGAPISIPVCKLNDYFTLLVNENQSPYYNHESDYVLFKIGNFCTSSGTVVAHPIEKVSQLDSFINQNKRNLQTIITTLNYLPHGYYKMPAEQKEVIQNNIELAVKKYVEDYVIPDMDISSEKVKILEEQIEDYKMRLQSVSPSAFGYVPDDNCGIGISTDD